MVLLAGCCGRQTHGHSAVRKTSVRGDFNSGLCCVLPLVLTATDDLGVRLVARTLTIIRLCHLLGG
jgi:hypothetical protein